MRVILASASPRRRELLARIAYPFEVRPASIDESRREAEAPEVYARRIAAEKAIRVSAVDRDACVLGADTIVCVDDAVLGKPADPGEAAAMLTRLSGRSHRVLTALAWAKAGEVAAQRLVETEVRFRGLSDSEIDAYVRGGEPMDKAGAYAIQGEGARFIGGATGSITNVIGLPLAETEALARSVGVPEPLAPLPGDAIALRLRSLLGEITAIAVASGRARDDVQLIAVSKGHPAAAAAAVIRAGAADLGENYVQEGLAKRRAVEAEVSGRARWHLIGPLQRNKARPAADGFDLIHTLDRVEVAQALLRGSRRPVRALVQVNVAGDPAKAGVAPEELEPLLASLGALDGLRLEGLMTIGFAAAGEPARRGFRDLRALLRRARERGLLEGDRLSMGMSGDYDVAIAEGATLVRLGTALFGPRPAARMQAEAGQERG